MRAFKNWGIIALLGFVVACGGEGAEPDDDAAPNTTAELEETEGSTTSTTAAQTTTAPTSTTQAENEPDIGLPDTLDLEPIAGSGVTGRADFTESADGQVSITVTLDDAATAVEAIDSFQTFAFLVFAGQCGDQTEPADFEGGLASSTVSLGEEDTSPAEVDLAELVGSPHAVLVTNAPGFTNLACANVAN